MLNTEHLSCLMVYCVWIEKNNVSNTVTLSMYPSSSEVTEASRPAGTCVGVEEDCRHVHRRELLSRARILRVCALPSTTWQSPTFHCRFSAAIGHFYLLEFSQFSRRVAEGKIRPWSSRASMGSDETFTSNGVAHDLSKLNVSNDANQPILTPYKSKAFDLDVRVVYAPLTRCRAVGPFCVAIYDRSIDVVYFSMKDSNESVLITCDIVKCIFEGKCFNRCL